MLVLKNGAIVDVVNGAVIHGTEIAVEEGRIVSVGDPGTVTDADVLVDLKGKFVMPALVDMHTHFSGSAGFEHLEPGERVNTYDYNEARSGFLDWGVLTVRTCGDAGADMLSFRSDSAEGKAAAAPCIYAAGMWVQGKEAHPAYTVYGAHPTVLEKGAICVDDSSDPEAIVESVKDMGSDWLKLFYGSNPAMFGDRTMTRMSFGMLKRLTMAGHDNGLKVMVHIDGASDAAAVVDAGVDSIEHLLAVGYADDDYSDELIGTIAEKGIVVVPTMALSKRFGGGVDFAMETHRKIIEIVGRMHKAGVTLCTGCDSGVPFMPFGETLHDELECMVAAGLSPMEALKAGTIVSTAVLGRSEAGSIESGKLADLLVLNGDPTADISNTKDIAMVIHGGKIIRDEISGL